MNFCSFQVCYMVFVLIVYILLTITTWSSVKVIIVKNLKLKQFLGFFFKFFRIFYKLANLRLFLTEFIWMCSLKLVIQNRKNIGPKFQLLPIYKTFFYTYRTIQTSYTTSWHIGFNRGNKHHWVMLGWPDAILWIVEFNPKKITVLLYFFVKNAFQLFCKLA
jgi:hypothetical protein